jgi:hypothetical protein
VSRVVRCSPRRSSVGTSAKDDAFRLDRTAHPLSSSFPLATQVVTNQPHDEEVALGSDTESSGDEAGVPVRPRSTRGTVFAREMRTTKTNTPEKKTTAPRLFFSPRSPPRSPSSSPIRQTGPAGCAVGRGAREPTRDTSRKYAEDAEPRRDGAEYDGRGGGRPTKKKGRRSRRSRRSRRPRFRGVRVFGRFSDDKGALLARGRVHAHAHAPRDPP